MKPVLVYNWDDYCDWLRGKGKYVGPDGGVDILSVTTSGMGIQVYHKELVQTHGEQYSCEFADSKSGFIVFALRSLNELTGKIREEMAKCP